MGDELGARAGSATSEATNVQHFMMVFTRVLISAAVEKTRKHLFEACLSDGMPADQASEVSIKVIHAALKLEAERFATS